MVEDGGTGGGALTLSAVVVRASFGVSGSIQLAWTGVPFQTVPRMMSSRKTNRTQNEYRRRSGNVNGVPIFMLFVDGDCEDIRLRRWNIKYGLADFWEW